ncbi:MAG: M3 family metallopeptidase [Bacteroidales bacterium]|nr:M3 family metallopeptidase [Bacteroidales bacterium]
MSSTHNITPVYGNPLLGQWSAPYEAPPFDSIEPAHFMPAINQALAEARANVEAIANLDAEPTFANTIEAIEDCNRSLERIGAVLFALDDCHTNEELQQVVVEAGPLMTRFENEVAANRCLFDRVKTLYNRLADGTLALGEEQATLLTERYKFFVRNGANLEGAALEEYMKTSEELVELTLRFGQNALADNTSFALHVTDEAQLEGLPVVVAQQAADEAAMRGEQGWVFTLAAPSYRPFMAYAACRPLREQMWRAYNTIGNRGNANDNNELIKRIVNLRLRMANLLGYSTWCDYVLDDRMVQSLPNLRTFMQQLHDAALPIAWADVEQLRSFVAEVDSGLELEPWDVAYYSEWLARELYDFDAEQLRPYFELGNVQRGVFELYGKLYGISFEPAPDVPVYHPDVKVFKVCDGNRFMGLLYLDMHPRPTKRSGAWMTTFRDQRNFNGIEQRPLVQVVCNFTRPTAETPSLLSFEEVKTFMHEMGHAMHGLLSDVAYSSLSCTSVKRDFVEMPSQLMENWCYEPRFLRLFARHYQTGKLMPMKWVDRLREHYNFQSGLLCLRQLNFGQIDIAFHSITQPYSGVVEETENGAIERLWPSVEGTAMSTNFNHIFSGGYASGYYGYKWAEVLDADVFSRFKADGIFNRRTAARMRTLVLSKGGTRHPALLFRDFMGRDPDQKAFLRRSNLL